MKMDGFVLEEDVRVTFLLKIGLGLLATFTLLLKLPLRKLKIENSFCEVSFS